MRSGRDLRTGGTGKGRRSWLKPLLALLILAFAGILLHRAMAGYDLAEIARQIASAGGWRVLVAFGFAAGSYACLTVFDHLALVYAGKPLPYPKVALASFTSLSLGHNLGFAALSSGAIRYRFYTRWGLSAADVGKVIMFCGATVGIGLAALAAAALLLQPELAAKLTGRSAAAIRLLAAAIVLGLVVYLVTCALVRRRLDIRGQRFSLPTLKLALCQFTIGPLNFALVAACLHQALATVAEIPYPEVAATYVLANIAALITHVPGGLGVIELVVQHLLAGARVMAGLILFRLVYFIGPLLCGALLLAISELVIRPSSAAPEVRET